MIKFLNSFSQLQLEQLQQQQTLYQKNEVCMITTKLIHKEIYSSIFLCMLLLLL